MKRLIIMAISALSLVLAGTAAAALTPSVYDPGATGCPTATFSNGVLHLAKNCATTTNAAAGADITGVTGPFTSASFTLASASQCQGGSPRFDIQNEAGTVFFLGCNNVTPTINANGTATYTFTAATIAAGGNQVPVPTGNIKAADVLIDVQGTADLTNITLNGQAQVPTPTTTGTSPTSKNQCKHGGYKTFTSPHFKNQGRCIKFVNHLNKKDHDKKDNDKKDEKHHLVKH